MNPQDTGCWIRAGLWKGGSYLLQGDYVKSAYFD